MLQRDRAVLTALLDHCDHIIQACQSVPDPHSTFLHDYPFQTRLCSRLMELGRLNSQLSDQVRELAPPIPWEVVEEVQNAYAIYCDPRDLGSVWEVLLCDVPILAAFYRTMLSKPTPGGNV